MSRRRERRELPAGALEHLRGADPVLRGIIDRVGPIQPSYEPDLWWALVDAIASQQLSVKAASTIVGRIAALAPGDRVPGPETLVALPSETLRACGLSGAKTRYVRDLAERWLDGSLRPDEIAAMPDEQAIEQLMHVKGVGRWTAEMVLMFSLGRPDVLAVGDLGLRTAVARAYGLGERPGAEQFTRLAEPWRPFRSTASSYLWRSLDLPLSS